MASKPSREGRREEGQAGAGQKVKMGRVQSLQEEEGGAREEERHKGCERCSGDKKGLGGTWEGGFRNTGREAGKRARTGQTRSEGRERVRDWGTWQPGRSYNPGDPSTEQRGTDESMDSSPASCLLPRERLLVCLYLPSSVKVRRGGPGLCSNLSFSQEIIL